MRTGGIQTRATSHTSTTADDEDLDMGVLGRLRQGAEFNQAGRSATTSAAEAGRAGTLSEATADEAGRVRPSQLVMDPLSSVVPVAVPMPSHQIDALHSAFEVGTVQYIVSEYMHGLVA